MGGNSEENLNFHLFGKYFFQPLIYSELIQNCISNLFLYFKENLF